VFYFSSYFPSVSRCASGVHAASLEDVVPRSGIKYWVLRDALLQGSATAVANCLQAPQAQVCLLHPSNWVVVSTVFFEISSYMFLS
jgi:hypothetical protein